LANVTRRDVLVLLFALSIAPARNFYFVGANDGSIFLIAGPEGHVLLDGGFSGNTQMIVASIAKLGFSITDVKALLNSGPRNDLAGGLATLQRASGAELWASDANARVIASGGADPDVALPLRSFAWLLSYPPVRVDHRVTDGETVRVGPLAFTAHITGGSTRGCTSWSFPVRDGARVLNVVSACGFGRVLGTRYPEQASYIERSLRVLRSLPADIWVTSIGRAWGRYRKFVASATAKNPVDPFIDREGYRAYINAAEGEFLSGAVH